MFLKGLQSFFVWKKCQVSSATAPSVPYKKVTLSNFIRMYTVCLWKASNRIFQNHYQKIPLCKIRCLRCSCTQVYCIHMPTEKEYLSFQYATSTHHFSSPHWTHSYVTKIHLFLANKQKRRKQCSYTRKQAHQPSDSGLPPNTFFFFFSLRGQPFPPHFTSTSSAVLLNCVSHKGPSQSNKLFAPVLQRNACNAPMNRTQNLSRLTYAIPKVFVCTCFKGFKC